MSCPTHLTCPYCPAQAYPKPKKYMLVREGTIICEYACPANHTFFAREEKSGSETHTSRDAQVKK